MAAKKKWNSLKGMTKYDYDVSYRTLKKLRKKFAEQGIHSMSDLVSEEVFEIKESYINRMFK